MKNAFRAGLITAAIGLAVTTSPTWASTIVVAQCDPVTDGDAQGCLFQGNINENPDPTNVNGYKNAEAAYNALMNPDITLNWITASDAPDFADFGTFSGFNATTGTFNLPGWDLEYYAVKAGPQFWLFEYTGSNAWSIPGQNGLSHLAFFGTPTTVHAPEPGTWAMMLIGFGAAGVSMRRGRRKERRLLQLA